MVELPRWMLKKDYIERPNPSLSIPNDFGVYAEHPRYGQGPRYTGYTPDEDVERVFLAHTPIIPETAIPADPGRQADETVPATHYGDVRRKCRDCGKWFIFFAEEQRYWHEELRFKLKANCVRCAACRKRHQSLGKLRRRYEELFHRVQPAEEELIEMAECCLTLVEAAVFGDRRVEYVRALLNRVARGEARDARFANLMVRVRAVELKRLQAQLTGQQRP